jgi:hypothetical protein
MANAARGAKDRMAALDAGVESRTKQEAALAGTPYAKLATPEALAAPGAQAAIQARIDDPNTPRDEISSLVQLKAQATVAQNRAIDIKNREASNTQALAQGNPIIAGEQLADRSLTIDEMKVRGLTPDFQQKAVEYAKSGNSNPKLGPVFAGIPTFKAAEAAGQAKVAASASNQQFFRNTDSLLVRGGTLDQLAAAGEDLQNTQLPFKNTLENWKKAQLGQGPQAAYAATALGVADDYAKVMGGGGEGSDKSRQQALDIIGRDLSPEGRAAAIAQIRKSVTSQRNGAVGANPYLADMYPDPATRQETPNVAGTQPAASTGATQTTSVANPAAVPGLVIHPKR